MDNQETPIICEIDGSLIITEADFHKLIAARLNFPSWYGHNLNALWDVLSADLPQPSKIIWHKSSRSEEMLGRVFHDIIEILERTQNQFEAWGEPYRFTYQLL